MIYVWECIIICTVQCMYVCIWVCMYEYLYLCMHTVMNGGPTGNWFDYSIYVCMLICMYVHVCMYYVNILSVPFSTFSVR